MYATALRELAATGLTSRGFTGFWADTSGRAPQRPQQKARTRSPAAPAVRIVLCSTAGLGLTRFRRSHIFFASLLGYRCGPDADLRRGLQHIAGPPGQSKRSDHPGEGYYPVNLRWMGCWLVGPVCSRPGEWPVTNRPHRTATHRRFTGY